MTRKVRISVDPIDGTRLDMPVTLEDFEVLLLESYLDCADRLLELKVARERVPCSLEIRIQDGQVRSINSVIPSPDEIAALLHRLRPFILADEPTSYVKVSGLLGKRFEYTYVRQILKEQQRLFDGRSQQEVVRVTIDGNVINNKETLLDWLNGREYHQDPEKRDRIEALLRRMPERFLHILYGMLSDKVQAIFQLATMIAVILGREQSVQIVDFGTPPEAAGALPTQTP